MIKAILEILTIPKFWNMWDILQIKINFTSHAQVWRFNYW